MNSLNHVAFIMDGNGRWGISKKKSRNYGHLAGVKTVKKIVEESAKLNIPNISLYVFSSENWNRPIAEVKYLFDLIDIYFKKEIDKIIKNNIKIIVTGRVKMLPSKLRKILKKVIEKTKKNKQLTINLAINYGSRNEIADAAVSLKKKIKKLRQLP